MAQTALLGRYGGSDAQAAFAAAAATATTVCSLFNFLVDGVSAKVGKSIGEKDWQMVGRRVRLSLSW